MLLNSFVCIKYDDAVSTLNLNGRHVSVYFAVYPMLVLAFLVCEVVCKLQLAARPRGLQPAVR